MKIKQPLKKNDPYSFEYNVFNWLLTGSIIFWVYRIATHLIFEHSNIDLLADFSILAITVIFIFISRNYRNYAQLIVLYCFFLIIGYIYFWYRLGGLNSSISYFYFALIIFLITILPSKSREIIVILFCSFVILMTLNIPDELFTLMPISNATELLISLDYVVNAVVIAVIIMLMKKNFDIERNLLEKNTFHLKSLNQQQGDKTSELLDQQQKIKSTKENLILLVQARTQELELRNKQLEAYAFHNAHLVRKPLSNMIGLINILTLEKAQINKEDLEQLSKKVQQLDLITKKINAVLQ